MKCISAQVSPLNLSLSLVTPLALQETSALHACCSPFSQTEKDRFALMQIAIFTTWFLSFLFGEYLYFKLLLFSCGVENSVLWNLTENLSIWIHSKNEVQTALIAFVKGSGHLTGSPRKPCFTEFVKEFWFPFHAGDIPEDLGAAIGFFWPSLLSSAALRCALCSDLVLRTLSAGYFHPSAPSSFSVTFFPFSAASQPFLYQGSSSGFSPLTLSWHLVWFPWPYPEAWWPC